MAARRLVSLFLIGACLPTISAQQGRAAAGDRLKFVVILSRHGVRSPTGNVEQLNQYAAQPWPSWEVPPGDLTPHGATLMTLFGAYYRAYFAQQRLLAASGCGDAARVSFYADSDQRTIETGKALAAGLFPGCAANEMPRQHGLAEGEPDPLFHFLSAAPVQPDRDRATAAIAGRIGGDPAALTGVYRPQLERMQAILLGCPAATPCPLPGHSAAKMLLDLPSSLEGGKGDHLAELKGPLNTASTISENLLLAYADGMPLDQVGWGRVDLATLTQLMDLHTAASDLTRRTSYLASTQASNLLAHILDTLQQAASGQPVPGALGGVGDRAVILVGHDTNLANLSGMLHIDWLIDGRFDDTPPGGALVFELWQKPTAPGYQLRVYYTAQTLDQMRQLTPLTLEKPPARANVFIPGCSTPAEGFPCEWPVFEQTLSALIDRAFVK